MTKPASSIEKVCRLLDAFRSRSSMGITELAAKTGLLPSDVHRVVRSLAAFGYIDQDPQSKRYRLGLELLKLGHLVHQRIELREVARPFLQQLAEWSQATANLAILDPRELEIIFVEQIDSPDEVHIKLRIGSRASPHATAVGKVLSAFAPPGIALQMVRKHGLKKKTRRTITEVTKLKQEFEIVRAQGYATDREEAKEGAYCVGAPVHDHTGAVAAAVSLSMMATRVSRWGEPQLAGVVKATAAKISTALGYQAQGSAGRSAHAE